MEICWWLTLCVCHTVSMSGTSFVVLSWLNGLTSRINETTFSMEFLIESQTKSSQANDNYAWDKDTR